MNDVRDNEIYVKNALEKSYLPEDDYLIRGEDPPDFYVISKSQKILLEVTRAEPICRSNKINRITSEISLLQLCDKLNSYSELHISPEKSLLIHITAPIKEYRKFKIELLEKLRLIVKDIKSNLMLYNQWKNISIGDNIIRIKLINNSDQKKRIIGYVGWDHNYSIYNIALQVIKILEKIIETKESKTNLINGSLWEGEKWLAIYNDFCLASLDNYIQAMQQIKVNHTFTKILLIEEGYKVTDIYS